MKVGVLQVFQMQSSVVVILTFSFSQQVASVILWGITSVTIALLLLVTTGFGASTLVFHFLELS